MALMNVSRRDLVKGAACATAAAASLGAVTAHASEAAPADINWDGEYDVVVMGLGAAGCNAAVAAYEEGVKVLAVEKAAEGSAPCNSNAAGQNVIATDDADALYAYFSALMGNFENWDEEALRAMCEGAAGNWNWAVDVLGMDPDVACPAEVEGDRVGPCTWVHSDDAWGMGRAGYMPLWNEFPELEGNDHCYNILVGAKTFDSAYYNLCMDAVNARTDGDRLTVWHSCPGKDLIPDDSGAVIGCVVEKDGEPLNIKVNGGVCLCTGGFEGNPDMMSDYTQQPYVYLQAGITNTGDGIRMAQKAGAQLWHMSNVSGWLWAYQRPGLSTCKTLRGANGIYAGCNGARFMDESTSNRHGRINIGGRWILDADAPAHLLHRGLRTESRTRCAPSSPRATPTRSPAARSSRPTLSPSSPRPSAPSATPPTSTPTASSTRPWSATTPTATPTAARARRTTSAVSAPSRWRRATFYAIKIGPSMYNTQGGPRHNGLAQVIGLDGLPIEGLFEGGEMGSVFSDMYNGGGNLSETMVFGRFAGQNAAKRAKGEFEGATEKAMTHSEKLAAEAASDADAAKVDVAAVADGTYEGTGMGYGGKMTVAVTVEGGKITGVEVLENAETPTIGGTALPVYCEQVAAGTDPTDLDVASGASNTLRGFQAAVEDALANA